MKQISARDLLARIEAGRAPVIVDVRSKQEYVAGHVPGAVHVPFWAVPLRASAIPASPDDELIVYCGHGPRAGIAATFLRAAGFTRVIMLDGHMTRWAREGLRQQRGPS